MDKIDLEELERLAKAATPGPWTEGRHDMFSVVEGAYAKYIYANRIPIAISTGEEKDCERVLADARYIAAACNAAPSLTAKVRELERQSEALAFWLAQFLPHAECPIFEDCPLSHKKNVDVRDCAKHLIQGVLDHD